jgi:GH15 family glucan-1,4-alpha-glucosidase
MSLPVVFSQPLPRPDQPGGSRNWDYRYCWLRDATFTLLALMHAGYHRDWKRAGGNHNAG